jgi:hypothetical protein
VPPLQGAPPGARRAPAGRGPGGGPGGARRAPRRPLPAPQPLFNDREDLISQLAGEFRAWCAVRHQTQPSAKAVEDLAHEWVQGRVPGAERVVAPERVEHMLALISAWVPDEATAEIVALLPDWVRCLGEQTHLPEPLIARSVATAGEDPAEVARRR